MVRQQRPKSLGKAVTTRWKFNYTGESKPVTVAAMEEEVSANIAAVRTQQDAIVKIFQTLSSCLEKIELKVREAVTCRDCRK